MDHVEAGRILALARRAGRKLADYPCARPDMAGALAIQAAMTAAMGVPVAGWKVGLTSRRAQEICGVDTPLAGPVFADCLWPNGTELAPVEGDLGILEAEIGLRMGADLPPRPEPYARAEVVAALGHVLPVVEWVTKRLPGGIREAAEWLVADGVINRGLVCGAEQVFDAGRDLAAETVELRRDGAMLTQGLGANALGGAVEVMHWLANDLGTRGTGLRKGDVVATGLICDVAEAVPGSRYEARFSSIGTVTLRVS